MALPEVIIVDDDDDDDDGGEDNGEDNGCEDKRKEKPFFLLYACNDFELGELTRALVVLGVPYSSKEKDGGRVRLNKANAVWTGEKTPDLLPNADFATFSGCPMEGNEFIAQKSLQCCADEAMRSRVG